MFETRMVVCWRKWHSLVPLPHDKRKGNTPVVTFANPRACVFDWTFNSQFDIMQWMRTKCWFAEFVEWSAAGTVCAAANQLTGRLWCRVGKEPAWNGDHEENGEWTITKSRPDQKWFEIRAKTDKKSVPTLVKVVWVQNNTFELLSPSRMFETKGAHTRLCTLESYPISGAFLIWSQIFARQPRNQVTYETDQSNARQWSISSSRTKSLIKHLNWWV